MYLATASSSSAKSPCCSWTPETLTARAATGSSASQGFSSVQPFSSTSVPISTIRPLRSAAGMNCCRRDDHAVAHPAGQRLNLDHDARSGVEMIGW